MAIEVPEPKVDLVAKVIELTKLLASNNPNTRSDGIKQIKQLLLKNSEDTSDGMLHILHLICFIVIIFYLIYLYIIPLHDTVICSSMPTGLNPTPCKI